MATPKVEIPTGKPRTDEENRVTVMILRGVGKVRSFRISPRFFILALVFFLAYLTCSAVAFNEYFRLRRQNGLQFQMIEKQKMLAEKDQKVLVRSKQHIDLLEDYIRTLEEQKETKTTTIRTTAPPAQKTPPTEVAATRPEEPEEITSTLVDIKDLVIQKELTRMRVSFKLVNALPAGKPVGGYYHMIAKGDSPNPPENWIYPQQELENGLPVNFKRGRVFLIQRFKPISWGFDISAGFPNAIMVLVYDQSGDLILKKSFEVNNEP
ncbi:hypothetical protein ACFL4N_05720 [Thermodesulfobacteriota bacterium]